MAGGRAPDLSVGNTVFPRFELRRTCGTVVLYSFSRSCSEGERRTIFAHSRIAEPGGPKFEDAIGDFKNALSQHFGRIRRLFTKNTEL